MDITAAAKLRTLLDDAKVCMFTTRDREGSFRSRPMALQQAEQDGDLWLFTSKDTDMCAEIRHCDRVSLTVTGRRSYLSISGRASLIEDSAKAAELWSVLYRAWFPKGLKDPGLQLIRVEIETAEFWESPGGAVVTIYAALKAVLTGERAEIGSHGKLSA